MKKTVDKANAIWVDGKFTMQQPQEPPPQEQPIEQEPPQPQPPQEQPNPEVWTDASAHLKYFAEKELETGFSTAHVDFGIVQMVQNEINLIWYKNDLLLDAPLEITGVFDYQTKNVFENLGIFHSYNSIYFYINNYYPIKHSDDTWTNSQMHFDYYRDVPLELYFSTAHVSFGIVQMVQNEINLIWEEISLYRPLIITGIVDNETIHALRVLFGGDTRNYTYDNVYNFIKNNYPQKHAQ